MRPAAENNTSQRGRFLLSPWSAFCLVVVLTIICFIPDLRNGFLDWDDYGYILENTQIRSFSAETIRWSFLEFYCNYWAPLTWLSLAVDYAFWGLNPVGYHLTNNLLHALNSGMFFFISFQTLHQYVANRRTEQSSPTFLTPANILYCALVAALMFALHPLRVESVAWITERKDVLSMFFGLLAVLAYLRHVRTARMDADRPFPGPLFLSSASYWLMLACYILSLCSKAMFITLPVVLLVLDWFPLRRISRDRLNEILVEKIPLLMLAGLASVITAQAMAVTSKSLAEINLVTRVAIAFKSLMAYLWMLVWPVSISPAYLHPGNVSYISFEFIASFLLVLTITAICMVWAQRRPVFLAAWLLFLIMLLPVLGFTQNGPQAMAARFTYLPGMPAALVAALGITALKDRFSSLPRAVVLVHAGVATLLVWYSIISVRDIGFWKDDVTLWSRVIELQQSQKIGKPYFQRALAHSARGDYPKALDDINVAFSIAESKKYRGLHELHAARARILKGLGDRDAAIAEYGKAIESAVPPIPQYYLIERDELLTLQGKRGQTHGETGNVERIQ